MNKTVPQMSLAIMKTDFIIVGQGLAGTILGFELQKAGKSVFYIDAPRFQKSSDVAAGIINPVVFKRLTQSWLIDELFPQLEDTYHEVSLLLNQQFYFPASIRKILGEQEIKLWQKKASSPLLSSYLQADIDFNQLPDFHFPYGTGWVRHGGWLNLKQLILSYHNYLKNKGTLLETTFEYHQLHIFDDHVTYRDLKAQKIIFCEGHRNTVNPYFSSIRYKLTKGEILTLRLPDLGFDYILNKNGFLMAMGNHHFRLGATYDWKQTDELPTPEGQQQLLDKLQKMTSKTGNIIEHMAGIRPTTHDRRPVIGLHPDHPQLGIFNGLGSKGCMLAPYFACQFKELLIGNKNALHPEVRLNRYYKV